MAIITSPYLYGARGRIDGVVLRQLNGETVAAARPRDRGHRSMNATQRAQMSAFSLAVSLCNLVPLWASRAYERVGMRSSWNIAVSTVTKAIRSTSTPTDALPSFITLLSCLNAASPNTVVAHGAAVNLESGVSDGVLRFDSPVDGQLFVFMAGGHRFPSVSVHAVTGGVQFFMDVSASLMWLFITADGRPVTTYAADSIYILS